MIKLNELKEWADDIKPILFDINVSLNNLRFLDHERLNKFRINHGNTYLTLLYQQHFILVLQLVKIFSKNNDTHKRNINILFNRFQNDKLAPDFLNHINSTHVFKSKSDILEAIKILKEEIALYSASIDNISNMRNKVFAHIDPNGTNSSIDINSYSILVDLCNKLYNTLIGNILGDKFNPNFVKQFDLRNILDLLER